MLIRQVNEVNGAVVSAHGTDCVYSGRKTTYRLSAGDYTTVATADHRIFTNVGWVRMGDLIPGESKVLTYKYGSGVNPEKFKKIDGVWVSRWTEQVRGDVSDRQLGRCAISGDPLPSSFLQYDEWEAAGYDRAFNEDYLGSNLDSYNHPNAAIEPRIPGIFQHDSVAEDELGKGYAGQYKSAQETADAIAAAWEQITDQIGRDSQIKLYKVSLGM